MSDRPRITVDRTKSFATQLKERVSSAFTAQGPTQGPLYDRLRSRLSKVTVDGVELYVAEGDSLLDEDQLWLYAMLREQDERATQNRNMAALGGMAVARLNGPPSMPSGLLGIIDENGNFVRWAEGTVLTYCVLKKTFTGAERDNHYQMVVENMQAATADWEAACDVRFQYRPELDGSDGVRPDGVIIPVREFNAGGQFIAASFFPNDPAERRRLLIDPSYYPASLRFNRVGVLRHELGHVLGFRHEHIRSGAPPECPTEETQNTFPFGEYDPKSVMHYFCGGLGSTELAITDLDRSGAVRLYGPPEGGAGLADMGLPAELSAPLPTAFVQ